MVADSSYAVLELLAAAAALAQPVTMITRLRLDAALYDPAPPREPGKKGAPRKKGERQPSLTQRLTDPKTVWTRQSVRWYGGVTARGRTGEWHGGVVSQRQAGRATPLGADP